MGRPSKPYSRLDREAVLNHLPDVLSIDKAQAEALIDRYTDEIPALAQVLIGAGTGNWRQWASVIMAKIPRSMCQIGDYSCVISTQDGGARSSLQFLASIENLGDEDPKKSPESHAEVCRSIHRGLYAGYCHKSGNAKYSSDTDADIGKLMMSWFESAKFDDELARHPWSTDTNLSRVLFFLENDLELGVKRQISERKSVDGLGCDFELVQSVEFDLYKCEFDRYLGVLDGIVSEFEPGKHSTEALHLDDDWSLAEIQRLFDKVPDSLTLLFSVHLSVNKALNEMAAQNEIHQKAFQMLHGFIRALNEVGIASAPDHILEIEFFDCSESLRNLILGWFGSGGELLGKHPLFKKPIFESDVDKILQWTVSLRSAYLKGRGIFEFGELRSTVDTNSSANPESSFNSFHRFLLAVVMLAAYYVGSKVDNELIGSKNRSKSIFPARGTLSSGPSIHVEEIFLAAFGQIYYSNTSFDIGAERLSLYAEHRRKIRELKMLLLWRFVKDRSVRDISIIFYLLKFSMFEKTGVSLSLTPP